MNKRAYDIIYCLMIPELGLSGLNKLLDIYGSYHTIHELGKSEIQDSRLLTSKAKDAIFSGDVEKDTQVSLNIIECSGIKTSILGSDEYPKSLLDLQNPPPILFYLGKMVSREKRISAIGSRSCSHYGMTVAKEIGRRSGGVGMTTVSGFAEGIDGIVHRSTVEAGGRTIAVLAGNLERPYPACNRNIIHPILDKNGCILTEVPPGRGICKVDFILRNRLIAGLGNTLVVVEAGKKSGCFSTVDYMNDLGRDTYVVPGNITSAKSIGTNKILQQGSRVYTSYDDFMIDSGLGVFSKRHNGFTSQGIELSNLDKRLLSAIESTPCTVEQLSDSFSMDVGTIAQSLTFLTLFGEVEEITPGWFIAKSH